MLNDATGFKHIYIATGYTDLRKGIDGLSILIHSQFDLNPFDEGSIFLFCGKVSVKPRAPRKNNAAMAFIGLGTHGLPFTII